MGASGSPSVSDASLWVAVSSDRKGSHGSTSRPLSQIVMWFLPDMKRWNHHAQMLFQRYQRAEELTPGPRIVDSSFSHQPVELLPHNQRAVFQLLQVLDTRNRLLGSHPQ